MIESSRFLVGGNTYRGVDLSFDILGSRLDFTGPGSSLGSPVAVVVVEKRPPWASKRREEFL